MKRFNTEFESKELKEIREKLIRKGKDIYEKFEGEHEVKR